MGQGVASAHEIKMLTLPNPTFSEDREDHALAETQRSTIIIRNLNNHSANFLKDTEKICNLNL
jgi:hypothetical protein